jgi:hypothetical protein
MPKLTFKEYKKIWLKGYAEMNLKPSTLALYNIILDKHLIPHGVIINLKELRPHRYRCMQVELLEDSFLSVRKSLEEGKKEGLEVCAVNS